MTCAATLLITNRIVTSAVVRHKWLRRVVKGGPTLRVHNGRFLANWAAGVLSRSDVEQAVRQRDLERLDQVRFAVLEAGGETTVVPGLTGSRAGPLGCRGGASPISPGPDG